MSERAWKMKEDKKREEGGEWSEEGGRKGEEKGGLKMR